MYLKNSTTGFYLTIMFFWLFTGIFAQVGINTTGNTPDNSAGLDIDFNNKGILIPRIALNSTTTASPVSSPATSLLVYNTATAGDVTPGYYYWDGSQWVRLLNTGNSSGKEWLLGGNAGTTPGTDFLGTTDAQDLVFKTNNTEKFRILTNGNVGIGTTAPSMKLQVSGDGIEIRNDNSDSKLRFHDPSNSWYSMGIDVSDSRKFKINRGGNIGVNTDITLSTNGNVGIGTNNPAEKLHINGSVRGNHNGALRISTGNGYVDVGPQNTSWAHFQTDRPRFYFNKGITVNQGLIGSYNENLSLQTSGSTRITVLNSNGNVGIGTNNPTEKLQINADNASHYIGNYVPSCCGSNQMPPAQFRGYTVGWNTDFAMFGLRDYGNDKKDVVINNEQDQDNIRFQSAGVDKVIIRGNGNVGIGTSTPATKLVVWGAHPGAGGGTGGNSDAPSQAIIPAGTDGVTRYNDWPSGWGGGLSTWDICGTSIYMTGYLTRSDKRFKKEIQSIEYGKVKERFMQLRPVSYYINKEVLNIEEIEANRLRFGFIANEVEDLFPNMVINAGQSGNITRGIEYDAFIPLLVKVVQQQQVALDNRTKDNEIMKQQLEQLQKEIEELKTLIKKF